MPAALGQKALSNRLGQKTINQVFRKRLEPAEFEQWSKERDPDGLAWRYDPITKLFYPLPDPAATTAPDVDKFVDTVVDASGLGA